jgi:hypothetical protein
MVLFVFFLFFIAMVIFCCMTCPIECDIRIKIVNLDILPIIIKFANFPMLSRFGKQAFLSLFVTDQQFHGIGGEKGLPAIQYPLVFQQF